MRRTLVFSGLMLCGISIIAPNSFAAPTTLGEEGHRAVIDDVPSNHWAYPCVRKLHELFQIPPPPYAGPGLWTRYELAIFCLRLKQDYPPLNDPTAKDILYTLNQEFAVEIAKFGKVEYVNPNLQSRVVAPPRLNLTPYVGKPGYRSYIDRKFLSPKETEDFKKVAEKTESPAK